MADRACNPSIRHLRLALHAATCLVALCSLLSSRDASAEWYVGCSRTTGEVVVGESLDEEQVAVVGGPFAGRRTAGFWVEENCRGERCSENGPCSIAALPTSPTLGWLAVCDPARGEISLIEPPLPTEMLMLRGEAGPTSLWDDEVKGRVWISSVCPTWRCDADGRCVHDPGEEAVREAAQPGGGWVAGDLTSVSLTASGSSPGARPAAPALAGPSGPGSVDVSPLIDNASAAVSACNYRAALASADHMLNFDPGHPWLAANRDKLRTLARRQQTTEQMIMQASSQLSAGNLKQARKLASSAADTALSCQSEVLAGLLRGIDTAIQQRRTQRDAKRRQAAASLLPGLINLSRVVSGAAAAGVKPDANALVTSTAQALGITLPGGIDPCAFSYEYRNVSNLEPACKCTGYVFDARQFRCVPAGR